MGYPLEKQMIWSSKHATNLVSWEQQPIDGHVFQLGALWKVCTTAKPQKHMEIYRTKTQPFWPSSRGSDTFFFKTSREHGQCFAPGQRWAVCSASDWSWRTSLSTPSTAAAPTTSLTQAGCKRWFDGTIDGCMVATCAEFDFCGAKNRWWNVRYP